MNAIEVLLAEQISAARPHEGPLPPLEPVALIYLGPQPDGRVLLLDARGDGWLRTAEEQLRLPLGVETIERFLGILQSEDTGSAGRIPYSS